MVNNIYTDPEKFNLEIVGAIDLGGAYEFDMFVVWKDADGLLYWDSDSGCSCPMPFEYSHLGNVSSGNKADVVKAALAWAEEKWHPENATLEVHSLIRKL